MTTRDPFDKFDKRFNFMWKIFWVMFGVVAAVIIAWYVLIGYVAVKAVDQVDKHGLESTIERIWKGPNHERSQGTNQ